MTGSILVAYATCTGSTVGVAEAIGETLRGAGLTVEVRPMTDVDDLTPYDAVVAGSAIQGSAWLPEAVTWVTAHRADLRQRPFAAFLVCLTLAIKNDEETQAMVNPWLDPIHVLVPVRSRGLFPGIVAPKQVPYPAARFGFMIAAGLGFIKKGDHRDWDAVRAWAETLPDLLIDTQRNPATP